MRLPTLTAVDDQVPLTKEFWALWRECYATALGASVFVMPYWLNISWDAFAGPDARLRPVRYVDEEQRTVAVSLHQEVVVKRYGLVQRIWRTIDFNAQRIAPVLAPDIPTMAAALCALYRAKATVIDTFDFFKLDPLDQQLYAVQEFMRQAAIPSRISVFNLQPQLLLPADWEAFTANKQTFRNKRRNLTNRITRELGPVRYGRWRAPESSPGTLDGYLAAMDQVFRDSWQAKHIQTEGEEAVARMRRYFHHIAEAAAVAGQLDLNIMWIDEVPAAFDLNLIEGETVYLVRGGFRQDLEDYNIGKLLMVEWLHDSHQRGDRVFEFGGEHLDYKLQWTLRVIPAYHLRIPGATQLRRVARHLRRS